MSGKEKELADSRVKMAETNRKFEQFRTSSMTLTNIISSQRSAKDVTGLGYNEVPPPFNQNYSSALKEDETVKSDEPSVPKAIEPSETSKSESVNSSVPTPEIFMTPPQSFQKRVTFVPSGFVLSDKLDESDVKVVKNKADESQKQKQPEQTETQNENTSKASTKKAIEKMSCFRCHDKGHVASCCPNKKAIAKQVKRE